MYTWNEAMKIATELDFEMGDNYYAVWQWPEEIEWIQAAWDTLTQKGLTSYANEYEKQYVQTQILTLAAMFCKFTEIYYDKKVTIDFRDWYNAIGLRMLQVQLILGKDIDIQEEQWEPEIGTEECRNKNFEYEFLETSCDTYSDITEAEINAVQELINYHRRDVYQALIEKYREPRLLYCSLVQALKGGEGLRWVEGGMHPL